MSPSNRTQRAVIGLAVCALGMSSMMTQLTLMRELLGVFWGNEMIFGVVLGNWLLLTGIGSALGRWAGRLKRPVAWLAAALLILAILPIADVFAIRTLRNVIFLRGAMIGVTETVGSCFAVLLPYCLVSGYLLTLACSVVAETESPKGIARVYFLDSVGMIAGGLLLTFVLIQVLSHFGCLYVPAFVNLAAAGALAAVEKNKTLLGAAGAIALGLVAVIVAVDLDEYSTRVEHAGFRVAYRGNSPYGSLVVTESAGQYNFIENGVPLFSTNSAEEVEETVHYAMAQRPAAKAVLLIGGGASGTAREVLKYGSASVDYVELDPLIVRVARRYVPEALADARINVIEGDGRWYVKNCTRRYDVLIADVPEPGTSQANRYYTREFFRQAKRAMNRDGVLCFPLGRYANYVSKELGRLIGTAHATLKQEFRNVLVLPGGRLFFLASDGELTTDIAQRLERAAVPTRLVNRGYLTATFSADRLADVARAASQTAQANTDFSPALYYYYLRQWISRFNLSFGLAEGLALLALAAYLLRIGVVPFAIFTTGLAGSALEVVILLAFQVLYGSVYHKVGMIMTMFMVGLAGGALAAERAMARWGRRDLLRLEIAMAACGAAAPLVLMGLGRLEAGAWANVTFGVLAAIPGALVGMEFPLAGKVIFKGTTATAAQLYAADLIGACLGAILVSTLLIPLIGVAGVCILTAGLKVASGSALLLSRGS